MKWITHQAGAVFGTLALGLNAPAYIGAIMGAILPDLIDQKVSRTIGGKKKRQKIFNLIHRGESHWYGWWLIVFLFTLMFPAQPFLKDILIGLTFGALSHIFLDMLTPRGVPFLPFIRRFNLALPICSTGKASEYVFLGCILIACLLLLKNEIIFLINLA